MAGDLNVGTLSGGAELETGQFGAALDGIVSKLNDLDGLLGDVTRTAAGVATGFLEAEGIITIVKDSVALLSDTISDLIMNGSRVGDVTKTFDQMTDSAGLLSDTLLNNLRQGTHNTVSDFQLMQVVNRDLAAGLNLTEDQYGMIAQASFALAKATGTDVVDAFTMLNRALVTGQARGVAYLTGRIDIAQAERKFADAAGKTTQQLTEEGKTEAIREEMLTRIAAALGNVGEQQDSVRNTVEQIDTSWQNFMNDLGRSVTSSPVIIQAFKGIQEILINTFGPNRETAIKNIKGIIENLAITTIDYGEGAVTVGDHVYKSFLVIKDIFRDLTQIVEGDALAFEYVALGIAKIVSSMTEFNLPSVHFKGFFEDDIPRIQGNIDSLLQSMKKRGDAINEDHDAEAKADAQTKQTVETLEQLKQKLIQTKAEEDAFVGPLQQHADAANNATGATTKLGDSVHNTGVYFQDTEQQLKAWRDAIAAINSVGYDFHQTLLGINGEVVAGAEYYINAGVALNHIKTLYGLTDEQVKALAEDVKISKQSTLEVTKLWDDYYTLVESHGVTATQKAGAAIDAWVGKVTAAAQKAGTDTEEFYDAIASVQLQKWNDLLVDWKTINNELTTNTKQGLQEAADKAKATFEAALQYSGQVSDGFLQHLRDGWDAAQLKADEWGQDIVQNADTAASAVGAVTNAVDSLNNSMSQLRGTIPNTYTIPQGLTPQQMSDYAASKGGTLAFDDFGNPYVYIAGVNQAPSVGSGPGNDLLISKFRANGGPVTAGEEYTVGERGTERFVPSVDGFILPTAESSGGMIINFHEGSVVQNYPINDDPRALKQFGKLAGNAIISHMKSLGMNVGTR